MFLRLTSVLSVLLSVPAKSNKKRRRYNFSKIVTLPHPTTYSSKMWYTTGILCPPTDSVCLWNKFRRIYASFLLDLLDVIQAKRKKRKVPPSNRLRKHANFMSSLKRAVSMGLRAALCDQETPSSSTARPIQLKIRGMRESERMATFPWMLLPRLTRWRKTRSRSDRLRWNSRKDPVLAKVWWWVPSQLRRNAWPYALSCYFGFLGSN